MITFKTYRTACKRAFEPGSGEADIKKAIQIGTEYLQSIHLLRQLINQVRRKIIQSDIRMLHKLLTAIKQPGIQADSSK